MAAKSAPLAALTRFFSTENRFSRAYKRLFSIREIETDIALQWFMGAVLLGYLVRFEMWVLDPSTTVEEVTSGAYLCWPFFQSCANYIWLSTLPYGYSQTTVYMALFGVMAACVWFMYQKRWAWAHGCIFVLLLAKLYFMSVNFGFKGNYDYYSIIFSLILLFLPRKRFFGQLAIVLLYCISTSAKIHPSWVFGSYFTNLQQGLPLFPHGTEMFFTNLVIFMEMIMSWFLFSPRKWLQRGVLAFFIAFHLYSGILVTYLYPTTVLPSLIILFGPWFKPYKAHEIPLGLKALPGWLLMACLVMFQTLPKRLPGDEKLTMENNFYALYMFEANHQCRFMVLYKNRIISQLGFTNARERCDIYTFYFRAKNHLCKPTDPQRDYRIIFDHSINGGPFYRIVDEPNLCALTYHPFSRNAWIKDETTAPAVGRSYKNSYR